MASEINVALRFSFTKGGASGGMDVAITPTLAGTKFTHGRQSIGFAAEEAINLGEATGGGGWFVAINRDGTNFLSIRQATGAANFLKLGPGEFCCLRFSTSTTAPFAIADTAACEMEYYVLVA
jgi:hypothetical protein